MDRYTAYAQAVATQFDIFRHAASATGGRTAAVEALTAIRDRVHLEVVRIQSGARHEEILEHDRMGLYGEMHLYHLLGEGWGAALFSTGPLPDGLDVQLGRSLVDIWLDLGIVMPGYDLHKRAEEALFYHVQHPVGVKVIAAIEDAIGAPLFERVDKGTLEREGASEGPSTARVVSLDSLVDAMCRFDSWDLDYWDAYVRLSIKAFGLLELPYGDMIEMAYRQLDNRIIPFQTATEIPEAVLAAANAAGDWMSTRDEVEALQRRFMSALILAIDPTMATRTVTEVELRELGLPEPARFDPDLW